MRRVAVPSCSKLAISPRCAAAAGCRPRTLELISCQCELGHSTHRAGPTISNRDRDRRFIQKVGDFPRNVGLDAANSTTENAIVSAPTTIHAPQSTYTNPTFWQLWFSPRGRISRSQYWLKYFLPACAIGAIGVAFDKFVVAGAGTELGKLLSVTNSLFYSAVALGGYCALIKRIHDRNKSGWLTLLPYASLLIFLAALLAMFFFAPNFAASLKRAVVVIFGIAFLGISIWFFVEFGCMRGTIGDNRYGADPISHAV
jgi:uncharacterized membrane protein YhaH (DUF805 family)